MEERRQITAHLSMDAYTGWRNLAESTEVSLAAILEAGGRRLAHTDQYDFLLRLPMLRAIIEEARSIDTERRARKGPRKRGIT